ncbi:MAG: hypothetical protein A4E63_02285 [Syntrophorhabdus sp. PtaU1.Bin050]|nr:MAG: hypothetical protein A4E63_02285 [Syntrophorhabdus sp. PtaU1.Bin050]
MPLLKVIFPGKRRLLIDEVPHGYTNRKLELEAGIYVISIQGPPFDFVPVKQKITLKNPGNEDPPTKVREVVFEKKI